MNGFMRTMLARAVGLVAPGTDMREVLGGAALVFAIRIAGAVLGYLSIILLVRWMGAFEFGVYAYAWSWAVLLATLLPLGLDLAVIRFVAEYRARGFRSRLLGIVAQCRRLAAAASIVVSVIALVGVVLARDMIADYYFKPILIALICVPALTLVGLYQGLARAFERVGLAYAPPYVLQPLILILGVGAIHTAGVAPTATLTLAVMLLACVGALAAQSLPLWHHVRRHAEDVAPRFHTRYWLAVSMPLLLTQSFVVVLVHTDILVLGKLMRPDDVAAYYAALRTAGVLGFLLFAVAAIAAPRIARLHASGSREEMQRFVTSLVNVSFWPSLAGAVVLIAAGPFLLELFDASFVDAYPALVALLCLFLVRAATGPVEYILNMTGNQGICARIYAVVAVFNLVANLALIPLMGIFGAALATALANILASGLMVIAVRRRLGVTSLVGLASLRSAPSDSVIGSAPGAGRA